MIFTLPLDFRPASDLIEISPSASIGTPEAYIHYDDWSCPLELVGSEPTLLKFRLPAQTPLKYKKPPQVQLYTTQGGHPAQLAVALYSLPSRPGLSREVIAFVITCCFIIGICLGARA